MDHNLSANSCPTTDKHHGTNLGVVADIGIMPDDGHGVNVCEIANPYIGTDLNSAAEDADRKSTRLNSSHSQISYAVFCLKKKKKKKKAKSFKLHISIHTAV